MNMEIRCIISVCIGLCMSSVGMALFRLGVWEVEKQSDTGQSEIQNEEDKPVKIPVCALRSRNIWQIAISVSNVIVALFLSVVYTADPLIILRVVFLCTVLYVCAWTDCISYLIPNKILLLALLFWMCLLLVELVLKPWNIRYEIIGDGVSAAALLLAGILCRLLVPESVGYGDLKLFIILGLYLGAGNTWDAVFYTLLASFIVSLFLLMTKRVSRKSVMPFAPFLLFGTLLAVFLHGA